MYGPAAVSPLSLHILGDKVLVRMRTLSAVEVKSRANCDSSPELLRRYNLTYLPDADTQQPRLRSVQMFGRQGTPEEFIAIPIANYGYGSASKTGKLRYQKSQSIALPSSIDRTEISSTRRAGPGEPDLPIPSGNGYGSLTDVTGDGRPDLIFRKEGKLWVARNRPGSSGRTIFSAQSTAQLSDGTLSEGAFETRSATNNRFTYGAGHSNVDQVWRQAIDVNGDGRIDIIDAAEEAKKWIIYLNTPGSGPSGVKWERREYSILTLYNELEARGHQVANNFLPLASRFTARHRQ